MLIVPSWAAENGYIPLPQIVSHCIFNLLILEGQQIDLHSHTSSWLCWLVFLFWCSQYGGVLGTLNTSLIGTPIPWRGWSTWGTPGNPWPSLSLMPPTTLTCLLRMSIHSLGPVSYISLSGPLFRNILFHSSYPLFDITCNDGGLWKLHHSVGMSWAPCFSPLFYNSLCNGTVTLLHCTYSCFYLSCPTSPTGQTHQTESYISGTFQGKSFLAWSPSKE